MFFMFAWIRRLVWYKASVMSHVVIQQSLVLIFKSVFTYNYCFISKLAVSSIKYEKITVY